MSVQPLSDAESFYRFLGDQLSVGGGAANSLEELLQTWRQQREYDETVAAVQEGVRDAEAGRLRPLRDLLNEA